MSTYAFESDRHLHLLRSGELATRESRYDHNKPESIEVPYTEITSLAAAGGRVVFCGGSPTDAISIISVDSEMRVPSVVRRSSSVETDKGYLSIPRQVEFPTENGLASHAFFYPPTNRDYKAPREERPPLIVISHGGPTSASTTTLKLSIQFWASRGFGVLDVNYGGSTGYGRKYRERLNGQWGVVAVDDCANGA
jgi:dipeptidyl aminopeptidase/acylaminoacyl peptidase